MTIPDRRLSTAEVQDLQRPLINDLLAYYRLVSDTAEELLDKAVAEGWTPDQLIDELDRLIGGDNRALETTAVPTLEELQVNKARRLDGRMEFQGLPVSIENAAGSTRSGVDPDGHPWSVTMLSPYGYVRGTEGVDGDEVDVYVGDNLESQIVFVVHIKNTDGTYDEDKCMIGYSSETEARKVIETHYDRPVIQSVETLTIDQFRSRLEEKPGKKITTPRPRVAVLKDIEKSLDRLCYLRKVRKSGDFREDDHPRDNDGKFSAGSGDKTSGKDDTETRGKDHAGRDQEDRREAEGSVSDGRGTHEGAVADIRRQGRERYAKRDVDYRSAGRADLKHVEDFNKRAGLPPGSRSVKSIFEHKDGTVGFELDPELCANHYHDTLLRLRRSAPTGAQVSLKPAEEYKNMRLFSASDSSAVVAMDGTDMVSVCAEKRPDGSSAASAMIWQAIGEGAETADCYGTYLPKLYAKFGFQPVAKLPWSQEAWDEYAEKSKGELSPDQLNHQKTFAKWNGKPDYIFLKLTGETSMPDLNAVEYVDDWDAGVKAQKDIGSTYTNLRKDGL